MENESKISYVSVFNENEVELSVTDGEGIYKVKVQVDRESLLQLITDFIDAGGLRLAAGTGTDNADGTDPTVAGGICESKPEADGSQRQRQGDV